MSTLAPHVRRLKDLAFAQGDQSGGPEALDALLDRLTELETENKRFHDAGLELQRALSRIDYLMGEPNEMQVSLYDLDYDHDRVVRAVERLTARVPDPNDLRAVLLAAEAHGRTTAWTGMDGGWDHAVLDRVHGTLPTTKGEGA